MNHPAQLPIDQLLKDCQIERTRRSGPGGQHRNKVETAIVILHLPSGLRAEANERRSQEQNRKAAVHRLRVQLALSIRQTPATSLSELWQQRAKAKKITVSLQHEDFPALLAEALEFLAAADFSIPATAERLQLTSSQLIKFLKIDPSALALVNQQRQKSGQSPLR